MTHRWPAGMCTHMRLVDGDKSQGLVLVVFEQCVKEDLCQSKQLGRYVDKHGRIGTVSDLQHSWDDKLDNVREWNLIHTMSLYRTMTLQRYRYSVFAM